MWSFPNHYGIMKLPETWNMPMSSMEPFFYVYFNFFAVLFHGLHDFTSLSIGREVSSVGHWTSSVSYISKCLTPIQAECSLGVNTVCMSVHVLYICVLVWRPVEWTCSPVLRWESGVLGLHCIFYFSAHQCKCQDSLTSSSKKKKHTHTQAHTWTRQLPCTRTEYSDAHSINLIPPLTCAKLLLLGRSVMMSPLCPCVCGRICHMTSGLHG